MKAFAGRKVSSGRRLLGTLVSPAPRLVVAGTHSGVGKTTVASGLMAALASEGYRVAPFKVGPDFIDPSYHALATGRPGRNLDAYLCGEALIGPLFAHGARDADIAVVEGVMGLFDGKGGGDLASTAHVAKLLDAPVVLVVDAQAMSRSAAAMVHGYATFDPDVRVAGVVLNRVGSDTHEKMLRDALKPLGIPILGVLRRNDAIHTPDRHLGLVPVAERHGQARLALDALGEKVARSLDLDAVVRLAATAGPLSVKPWSPESPEEERTPDTRVGIAGGPSFSFLYRENVELMEGAGAEIVTFDPTADEALPDDLDALYLGGGFPETYAESLSTNETMRKSVREFAASDRPVLAECGGLLYLCRSLDGWEMCGVLEAEARMAGRLSLGYREAQALSDSPLAERGAILRGHEFHYSAVEPAVGESPAWDLAGRGREGFVSCGVHASYLHTHWAATPELPQRFLRTARRTGVRA